MPSDVHDVLRSALAPQASDLLNGRADDFHLGLRQVHMVAGPPLELPAPGVTVIVGGNNVGKSTLLREIHQHLQQQPDQDAVTTRLTTGLRLQRTGSSADFLAWLVESAGLTVSSDGAFPLSNLTGRSATSFQLNSLIHHLRATWREAVSGKLSFFHPVLVHYADTQARLELSKAAPVREDASQPPAHPVHALADDPGRLALLDQLAQRIFGEHLVLDDVSASNRLRVSQTALPMSVHAGRLTPEFRSALLGLPELADQGDGMRSLIGLLLPLIAASPPLALIDEPEAFLHPPQAAQLGRALAEQARDRRRQVLVATHDRNLLGGLLDVGSVAVSIVRLDRPKSGPTIAHQLDVDRARVIAQDSVLRYTNALEGLFHRQVVLGESSDDCSFYGAALDQTSAKEDLPVRASEVLFIPCGGKTGMARLAAALKELHVPVVATPDLDILSDEATVRALVEALAPGAWQELKGDYDQATVELRQPRDQLSAFQVQQSIDSLLQADPAATFDASLRKRVQSVLRAGESRFSALKNYGMSAFRGSARVSADRLVDALDSIGLVVVKEGELERFAPSLAVRKGAGWLPAALEAGAHLSEPAASHVRRLVIHETLQQSA